MRHKKIKRPTPRPLVAAFTHGDCEEGRHTHLVYIPSVEEAVAWTRMLPEYELLYAGRMEAHTYDPVPWVDWMAGQLDYFRLPEYVANNCPPELHPWLTPTLCAVEMNRTAVLINYWSRRHIPMEADAPPAHRTLARGLVRRVISSQVEGLRSIRVAISEARAALEASA